MTPAERRAQLEFFVAGGAVKRFHTVDCIREQTVAEHSFGVAWLVWALTEGRVSAGLIMAALAHDLAEARTGDVPSMTKRYASIGIQMAALEADARSGAGIEFALTEEEQRMLDLADNLEGMLYCIRERQLGNRGAELWYPRFLSYIRSIQQSTGNETHTAPLPLLAVIEDLWEEIQ